MINARSSPKISATWIASGTVITFVAFYPILHNGFVNWDDDLNFLQNPYFRGLGWEQVRWMFTHFHLGVFVPVTWLTCGADYLLWGLNPHGYHLTSLIFQMVNAALLAVVIRRLLEKAYPEQNYFAVLLAAAFGALFFAIHPLRVESVAWATERRDVVSGFFYLLTVWAYVRAQDNSQKYPPWLTLSVAAFLLGLLSKPSGAALPVVLTLLDAYPLRRLTTPGWRIGLEKLPFWFLSLGISLVAILGQRSDHLSAPLSDIGVGQRLLLFAYNSVFYLRKTIYPAGLSPYYPLDRAISLKDPWFAIPAGLFVIGILFLWLGRRRFPGRWGVGCAYLVLLAPVSGLFQSGHQLSADRYSYLPAIPLAVGVGFCLFHWMRSGLQRSVIVATGLVVLSASLTWQQSLIWRDSKSLWTQAAAFYPDSGMIQTNLGMALVGEGDTSAAAGHFRRALQGNDVPVSAYNNLGAVLASHGDLSNAAGLFEEALKRDPDNLQAKTNLQRIHAMNGTAKP